VLSTRGWRGGLPARSGRGRIGGSKTGRLRGARTPPRGSVRARVGWPDETGRTEPARPTVGTTGHPLPRATAFPGNEPPGERSRARLRVFGPAPGSRARATVGAGASRPGGWAPGTEPHLRSGRDLPFRHAPHDVRVALVAEAALVRVEPTHRGQVVGRKSEAKPIKLHCDPIRGGDFRIASPPRSTRQPGIPSPRVESPAGDSGRQLTAERRVSVAPATVRVSAGPIRSGPVAVRDGSTPSGATDPYG
jgi:hypothetical protein